MEEKMKKKANFLILLILVFSVGCNIVENPTIVSPTQGEEPVEIPQPAEASAIVKSDLARELSPQVDPETILKLTNGNTAFAFSFFDQLDLNQDNIIFSPISLSLALSMTMVGADTSTEQAMMDVLQFSLPGEEVHRAFNALLLTIEESQKSAMEGSEGSQFQLNIANSIWGQSGFQFKSSFLDTLALNYGSGLYNVDFIHNQETAREVINQWVEDETQDKIKNLIPEGAINSLTRLVLANAIYFNGSWLHPFNETGTSQESFTTLDGSITTVEMMRLLGESFSYSSGDDFQAINLPYLSRDFSMIILVPQAGKFSEFRSSLTSETYQQIINDLNYESVNLYLPKFDFNTSIAANDLLINLGMGEAFDADYADFSGMTDEEDLFITNVLQKATITVDEEGTEAAAATAVIMGIKSAPTQPIELVIDRPFLFFIQHQPTGSILFMGQVINP